MKRAHGKTPNYLKKIFFENLSLTSFCFKTAEFPFYPAWTQQPFTQPPVKCPSFPLWKNYICEGLLFCNVLTSCFGYLWFGTHPYYSLNPYVHLYYLFIYLYYLYYGGVSQLRLQFLQEKHQKAIIKLSNIFKNLNILKTFCDVRCTNKLTDLR